MKILRNRLKNSGFYLFPKRFLTAYSYSYIMYKAITYEKITNNKS